MFADDQKDHMTEGVRYMAANSGFVGIVHRAQIKCTINLPASLKGYSRGKIHNHKRFQATGDMFREPPGSAVLHSSGRVKSMQPELGHILRTSG